MPLPRVSFLFFTLSITILTLFPVFTAKAARLTEIFNELNIEETVTEKEFVAAMDRKVREVLTPSPINYEELGARVDILVRLGFEQEKLLPLVFQKTREENQWFNPWVRDNLWDFNNIIAQDFIPTAKASFEEVRQPYTDDDLPSMYSCWDSIQELLHEMQEFLAGNVDRILNETVEDLGYNIDNMRKRYGVTSILSKHITDHFPKLKDNEDVLKLYADIVTVMWADICMFAHLEDVTPHSQSVKEAPPLLEWRTAQFTPPSGEDDDDEDEYPKKKKRKKNSQGKTIKPALSGNSEKPKRKINGEGKSEEKKPEDCQIVKQTPPPSRRKIIKIAAPTAPSPSSPATTQRAGSTTQRAGGTTRPMGDVRQVVEEIGQLAEYTTQLTDHMPQLTGGIRQMRASIIQLRTDTEQLRADTAQLKEATTELTSKVDLQTTVSKAVQQDISQLKEITQELNHSLLDFIAKQNHPTTPPATVIQQAPASRSEGAEIGMSEEDPYPLLLFPGDIMHQSEGGNSFIMRHPSVFTQVVDIKELMQSNEQLARMSHIVAVRPPAHIIPKNLHPIPTMPQPYPRLPTPHTGFPTIMAMQSSTGSQLIPMPGPSKR
ncbi:hypothetical protein [Sansalvadorimonas verongulae]|uniref:hypothetical protein n=1 Tax=Sansalvadorimonas verongulae TaxID=2172824 RepID=UPI0012BC86A7|nr:hypothetical protein [Sansalvadorimonas verongulae]MTI11943.1 hypothetical protein [Sansalvadorimonas verongulae]